MKLNMNMSLATCSHPSARGNVKIVDIRSIVTRISLVNMKLVLYREHGSAESRSTSTFCTDHPLAKAETGCSIYLLLPTIFKTLFTCTWSMTGSRLFSSADERLPTWECFVGRWGKCLELKSSGEESPFFSAYAAEDTLVGTLPG